MTSGVHFSGFRFNFSLSLCRGPRSSWRGRSVASPALHVPMLLTFPGLRSQPTRVHLQPTHTPSPSLQQPPGAVPPSQGSVGVRERRTLFPAAPCFSTRLSIQPRPAGLRWASPPYTTLQPVRLHIPLLTTPRCQS